MKDESGKVKQKKKTRGDRQQAIVKKNRKEALPEADQPQAETGTRILVKFRPTSGLIAGDALNFEGWGMRGEIKGHNEMIKETNLAEQVFGEIGRKAGFNLDYIRADHEFYIVVINLGPGTRDHATQITLRAILNFYSYLLANPRLKQTVIGATVHDRFKSLADSVTVDDFDRKYWPPNELLLGNASITEWK